MFSADPIGLLAFLWLLIRGSGGGSAPSPRPAQPLPSGGTTPYLPASTQTPPWPAAQPTGLPSFPGNGWEYDEPPPASVKQRAAALVSPLWTSGAGAHKVEQTAGRWIAYRAEKVRSGKKGVVAYRVKAGAAAAPGATASRPPAAAPRPAPATATPTASNPVVQLTAGATYRFTARVDLRSGMTPADLATLLAAGGATEISVEVGPPVIVRYVSKYGQNAQIELNRPISIKLGAFDVSITFLAIARVNQTASAPAPAAGVPVSLPAPIQTALPDLKYGDGLKPKPPVEEVKIVQQRLRVTPVDGRFGTTTRDAVIDFQVRTGLAPNVKRAELVKRGFGAVKKATWEKLFTVQA